MTKRTPDDIDMRTIMKGIMLDIQKDFHDPDFWFGEDHEVEYEWIGEAEYDGGYFWMTTDDRKELFQTITRIRRENLKLAPALLVGGSGYALDIAAFIRVIKECPEKDGMHGVPRQCWRSL